MFRFFFLDKLANEQVKHYSFPQALPEKSEILRKKINILHKLLQHGSMWLTFRLLFPMRCWPD